jgi:hypothetical protein
MIDRTRKVKEKSSEEALPACMICGRENRISSNSELPLSFFVDCRATRIIDECAACSSAANGPDQAIVEAKWRTIAACWQHLRAWTSPALARKEVTRAASLQRTYRKAGTQQRLGAFAEGIVQIRPKVVGDVLRAGRPVEQLRNQRGLR